MNADQSISFDICEERSECLFYLQNEMRRAGITQKDIDNARKSQEMNIIEDCKKFRHIHNHIFKGNRRWYPPTQIRAGNKMSDGYEIKERTVKIWIMLIMKGQLFFILPQHTDILSWLDIYYHKERSKLTSEKIIDQCPNWCWAAWWHSKIIMVACLVTLRHADPIETGITACIDPLMYRELIHLKTAFVYFDQ